MKRAAFGFLITLLVLFAAIACGEKKSVSHHTVFVTTNEPLAMIIREITGDSNSVYCLVPPGVSQHTFSPKPADISRTEQALALFYISDNLDAWVSNFENVKTIRILNEIPGNLLRYFPDTAEEPANIDPHFWTDPVIIKSLVPRLAKIMSGLNPAKAEIYKANAVRLVKKLAQLDNEIRQALEPYKGKSVLLFHPSFLYFLSRYGLEYAGAVETAPGKQPTLQDIAALKRKIHALGLKAVYTEPQLPKRSLNVLVHATGIRVMELDPLGGVPGRNNYFDLMRFNLKNLLKGFED
jgi:ABC-type Zn uptake system ZnuABC Zn-binding protein ZnuA